MVSWTDTSTYESRLELAIDDTLAVAKAVAANIVNATFTGLIAGTSYHFYVRACNTPNFCSSWLGPVGKRPDGTP